MAEEKPKAKKVEKPKEEQQEKPKVDFNKFPEYRKVKSKFPEAIEEAELHCDCLCLRIKKEFIVDVCKLLRDDEDLKYDYLADLCGVHYPKREKPLEVVYNLLSIPHAKRVRLKVSLAEDEEVPSVCEVWPSANWFEREAFDMLGIRFANHPDLRRILLPEDWEGHPLRKDYPLEGPPGYREKWLREHLPYYNKL